MNTLQYFQHATKEIHVFVIYWNNKVITILVFLLVECYKKTTEFICRANEYI